MDVLNVSHRFFLPLGLLLKLIEHVQQHVHPACIESVFRSPANRKKK